MYIAVYENPEKMENKVFNIDINNYTWESWYNEISRRHWILFKEKTCDLPIFDIDECMELWQMSISHLIAMMDFLKINK